MRSRLAALAVLPMLLMASEAQGRGEGRQLYQYRGDMVVLLAPSYDGLTFRGRLRKASRGVWTVRRGISMFKFRAIDVESIQEVIPLVVDQPQGSTVIIRLKPRE